MKFNQFYYNKENGMILRSGKTINCIINSDLYKLLQIVLDEIKWWDISECNINKCDILMNEHIDISKDTIKLNSYSVLTITIVFLELYYNDLYKNKELYKFYKLFKNRINDFIIHFDTNKNKICDYIVEYEDWDYKASFPIYREYYGNVYEIDILNNNKLIINKNIDFIKELYKWKYKLSIPHNSLRKHKLYKQLETFTNEDCVNHIFTLL
jgi:hypothetical protein